MIRRLGWGGIVRLGLVQASIGAMVMLATVVLNRVMVVEMKAAAAIPAGLIAWHYAVQLGRPLWGHGGDGAARRTPWVLGGLAVLAAGVLVATQATLMMGADRLLATGLGVIGFALIGAGVGCAGTSLLALLAARVGPERRAGGAAICWILMVLGIVVAAGVSGHMLEPYSPARLWLVMLRVCGFAVLLPVLALWRLEAGSAAVAAPEAPRESFPDAVRAMWADPAARRFTAFVFLSMLAYSVQELIVEPFAGLVFGMSPGASTKLASFQHGGVLLGMIAAGLGATLMARRGGEARLDRWILAGCCGAALALVLLAQAAPGWPLKPNVMLLGFSNGVFTVSAIGAMVGLAGDGGAGRAGVRMGVFGAAQAIAFGLGGLIGAVGVDVLRGVLSETAAAFHTMFAVEAVLFLGAAAVSLRVFGRAEQPGAVLPAGGLAAAGAGLTH